MIKLVEVGIVQSDSPQLIPHLIHTLLLQNIVGRRLREQVCIREITILDTQAVKLIMETKLMLQRLD
ncbi:hypothetical protein CJP46_18080 [Paenibacillus sp. XY044]|nr:hypothetical protein CJP46_18080 [Paenibacillus sp. XY044]